METTNKDEVMVNNSNQFQTENEKCNCNPFEGLKKVPFDTLWEVRDMWRSFYLEGVNNPNGDNLWVSECRNNVEGIDNTIVLLMREGLIDKSFFRNIK